MNQKFGNGFAMILGIACMFIFSIFFIKGCTNNQDNIIVKEQQNDEEIDPMGWVIFK
jgi:hypothetical protein